MIDLEPAHAQIPTSYTAMSTPTMPRTPAAATGMRVAAAIPVEVGDWLAVAPVAEERADVATLEALEAALDAALDALDAADDAALEALEAADDAA